jgi:hypothetical protein
VRKLDKTKQKTVWSSMRYVILVAALAPGCSAQAVPPRPACRVETLEGEVTTGQGFRRAIGGGLEIGLQPIAAGWIVRVLPAGGWSGLPDYAEVATPPYESVNPLSISTDFAFRAQDAVAWNPRRFRFASTRAEFDRLVAGYKRVTRGGALTAAEQAGLAQEMTRAAEGTLTILDARLVAGVADQSMLAAPVALHLEQTAHMLVSGHASPLGRLLWMRFRIRLVLPPRFVTPGGVRVTAAEASEACAAAARSEKH